MLTTRHPLVPDRALVVSRLDGLVVLGIRGSSDAVVSGPLAIREADVAAFLAAVAAATWSELAGDMERVREVLRAQPGIAGYKRLRAALTGMSMERRRAAVRALQDAGELLDRGDGRRPRLYIIAPKPGYSNRNLPQTPSVDLDPGQAANPRGPQSPEASS